VRRFTDENVSPAFIRAFTRVRREENIPVLKRPLASARGYHSVSFEHSIANENLRHPI